MMSSFCESLRWHLTSLMCYYRRWKAFVLSDESPQWVMSPFTWMSLLHWWDGRPPLWICRHSQLFESVKILIYFYRLFFILVIVPLSWTLQVLLWFCLRSNPWGRFNWSTFQMSLINACCDHPLLSTSTFNLDQPNSERPLNMVV